MITKSYTTKAGCCGCRTRSVRVLKPILGCEPGKIVDVKVSPTGIPFNPFWRRRFRDMKIDNCIEFLDANNTEDDDD
jgi:hypothetical protein